MAEHTFDAPVISLFVEVCQVAQTSKQSPLEVLETLRNLSPVSRHAVIDQTILLCELDQGAAKSVTRNAARSTGGRSVHK